METILNSSPNPKFNHLLIKVDNLKCGGCATSIEMGLLAMKGVTKAHVMQDTGEVDVTFEKGVDAGEIKEKLKHLGYPESGTTEGLEKFATNVKSYVSCAIGKLNHNDQETH